MVVQVDLALNTGAEQEYHEGTEELSKLFSVEVSQLSPTVRLS
jgi:hypothetical protein